MFLNDLFHKNMIIFVNDAEKMPDYMFIWMPLMFMYVNDTSLVTNHTEWGILLGEQNLSTCQHDLAISIL